MKRFRPPSFRSTLAVTPYYHHLLLHHRPLSTSSYQSQAHLQHLQGTPEELAFSSQEMLRTIKAMQGQEDDKGSRRLDCESDSCSRRVRLRPRLALTVFGSDYNYPYRGSHSRLMRISTVFIECHSHIVFQIKSHVHFHHHHLDNAVADDQNPPFKPL